MEETKTKRFNFFNFLTTSRAVALLLFTAVFYLIFALSLPQSFGTFANFKLILLNMSSEALIVVGITMLLLCAEIDLSLGAQMVLSGVICGRFMIVNQFPSWAAILIALVICLCTGFINGVIVAKMHVPSFIVTLATSMIYLGIAVMLAGTGWTDFPDPIFRALGQQKIFGFQLPVLYMLVAFVVFSIMVAQTRYFRQCYYIGGNTKAAILSGINIDKTKIVIFMLAGFLAALAGIVTAMRYNSSVTSIGTGVEMRAVTAAVIGGVAFTGGRGTMTGAAVGAFFIACLNNLLICLKINPNYQFVVTGVILILAIILDVTLNKRKVKSEAGENVG